MEAKNVLDVCFFVNVWLPVAGNIRFLQRWRMRWALSFCRRLISFSDVLFAAIGQCGLPQCQGLRYLYRIQAACFENAASCIER